MNAKTALKTLQGRQASLRLAEGIEVTFFVQPCRECKLSTIRIKVRDILANRSATIEVAHINPVTRVFDCLDRDWRVFKSRVDSLIRQIDIAQNEGDIVHINTLPPLTIEQVVKSLSGQKAVFVDFILSAMQVSRGDQGEIRKRLGIKAVFI